MRCLRCNAKWDNGNIKPPLSCCPICEADLTSELSGKEYSNIGEFLYELRLNNADIFWDSRRTLAYLNDYFPREDAVRGELKKLYDFGLMNKIHMFLDGNLSGSELSDFLLDNVAESVRDEVVSLLSFALCISTDKGTNFEQSDFYRTALNVLNNDSYKIKALEKAIVYDNDASLKEQLVEYKIKTGDIENAVNDLERAAAKGDATSLYSLAVMYKEGTYYEKDLNKALGLLKIASEKGNVAADYLIADLLFETDKDDEALSYLRKAADNNNVKAQCRLYNELYSENRKDAVGYLKKAAFLNYAPAMYEYSLHLLYGDDIDQDIDSAIRFMEEAAVKNDKDAISKLAYIYSVGFLVKKDTNKAQKYKSKIRGIDNGVI